MRGLRGRLRRHNFTVYKKGSKGVSFVCAVKRKFRDESTVFSESIQGLISFIEANQEISAAKLPMEYLGIDADKLAAATAQPQPSAPEPPAEPVNEGTEASAEAPEPEPAEPEPAEAEASAPVGEAEVTEAAPAPKEVEVPELSAEEKARLNTLMSDLRWLVREGYVTEYGDGRLFASPVQPKPKPKPKVEKVIPEKAEVPAEEPAAASVEEVLPEAAPAELVEPTAGAAEPEPATQPVDVETTDAPEPVVEEAAAGMEEPVAEEAVAGMEEPVAVPVEPVLAEEAPEETAEAEVEVEAADPETDPDPEPAKESQ